MAAHLEEQQELDNFKYFWKTTGKWLFAVLILAALGYLGYTVYQNRKVSQNQEAAAILAEIVEKAQSKAPQNEINAELAKLQQSYPQSISAAQATLMAAATEFDAHQRRARARPARSDPRPPLRTRQSRQQTLFGHRYRRF